MYKDLLSLPTNTLINKLKREMLSLQILFPLTRVCINKSFFQLSLIKPSVLERCFFCPRLRLRLPFDEVSDVVCCSLESFGGSWLWSVESTMTSGSWILRRAGHVRTIQRHVMSPSFRTLAFRNRKPSRNRCCLFFFEIVISIV